MTQKNTSPGGNHRADDSLRAARDEELADQKLSILVADDTPTFQKVISNLLRRRGHTVTLAENGREALDLYSKAKFDAIVLDVKMPFMDGLQVTREIRRHEQTAATHTLIVALTTHSLAHDREECLAAGMDAYLTKPVDAAKLIQIVEQGVGHFGEAYESNCSPVAGRERDDTGEGVVHFDAALRRLGGDIDLFQEFIAVFDEDMPGLLQSLRQSAAAQNGTNVERDAHSIRGLISNFGAPRAVQAAECLEDLGKSNSLKELDTVLQKLEFEVRRLDEALNAYRREASHKGH